MEDKKTIGITDHGELTLGSMVETGHFIDAIDAAKFAMGLAVRSGKGERVSNPTVEGAGTKWNVGSFDPDNDLQTLLSALYPSVEAPYRLLEYLIDEGLRLVAAQGVFDVVELIGTQDS
jgi:hypothetical protein